MIIIWNGRGIFALIIPVVMVLIAYSLSVEGEISIGINLLLSAIPVWFLGKHWNSQEPELTKDKETGRIFKQKIVHSLFWLRMEYWAFILLMLGSVFVLGGLGVEGSENIILIGVPILIIFLIIRSSMQAAARQKTKVAQQNIAFNAIQKIAQEPTIPTNVTNELKEKPKQKFEPSDHSRFMPSKE